MARFCHRACRLPLPPSIPLLTPIHRQASSHLLCPAGCREGTVASIRAICSAGRVADDSTTRWSRWFFAPPESSLETLSPRVFAANLAAAAVLVALAIGVPLYLLDVPWNWAGVWKYRQKFFDGYLLTVGISLVSLLLSLVCGLVSAFVGRARFLPLRYVNRMYVDLVRCTPIVVQILFFYYVAAPAVGISDRNLAGIGILALSYGAYISEIIRAGIENIGRSQWESAKAIGLTPVQTYRYVVFPQALRQILPPLAGQLMSLIKDSSLLSYISVGEFTKNAMETSNITYSSLECYTLLAAGYLLLTLPITFLTRALEKRGRFET